MLRDQDLPSIALNVHALNERHLVVGDICHVDVDVQDEVGDFLHCHPCHRSAPSFLPSVASQPPHSPMGCPVAICARMSSVSGVTLYFPEPTRADVSCLPSMAI